MPEIKPETKLGIEPPFYGLRQGDEVFVPGRGIGRIVETHEASQPTLDSATVEIRLSCRCSCGHRHENVEIHHIHPSHLSLTPTGRAMRAYAR